MKSLAQKLPIILIWSLLIAHGVLFLIFSGNFPEQFTPAFFGQSTNKSAYIMAIVGIFELAGLTYMVRSMYVNPVHALRTEIAYFLAGTESPIKLESHSLNPELNFIGSFFHRSLEILRNFKEEFRSGRILKSEVELASDIQKHVLKKDHPVLEDIEIIADTKSASEVGGDSYDIIKQGDNTYVYVGDVTGHGVASGFVMMVVNALISGFSKMLVNSADILSRTNEILKPRVKSNMLMTLLMVRWNEKEKKLFMTGAGHEYLIVYKKNQNKVYSIKSGGVALGMTRDISKLLKEVQISFEKGDSIILYTDGITEARNGKSESDLMFGLQRLVDLVQNSPSKTAIGIFNHITIEISKFMGYSHRQFDDISLIVMHYKEPVSNDGFPVVEETRDIPKENITEWNWH